MTANVGTNSETDQLLRKAMKLLHSSHPNSAIELRLMLDDVIKQRYGPEKMISNSMTQRQLDDEANFPGRATTPPQQQQPPVADSEIINLTHSPVKTISDSPDTIADSDDALSAVGATITDTVMNTAEADDSNLKDFGDLNCCVCGEMVFTATNRLIECSKCGTLYHQECHKPTISHEDASEDHQHNWQCDACLNKPTTSKASGIVVIPDEPMPLVTKAKSSATSSRSSSSSNSSSPYYKQETAPPTGAINCSKQPPQKSTKPHKEERTSSSSKSASSVSSGAINASASGDKKRSSSHSINKSTSKSSSSKHHESSSSSKRRSNK